METKRELNRVVNEVETVLHDLEKASTILNHWTDKYLFYKKPDPRAAIAWGSKDDPPTVHENQSAQWFIEYKLITQFIEIASDYVQESKERLRKALENGTIGLNPDSLEDMRLSAKQ